MQKLGKFATVSLLVLLLCTAFGLTAFAADVEISIPKLSDPYIFNTNSNGTLEFNVNIHNGLAGLIWDIKISASDQDHVLVFPTTMPSIAADGNENVLVAVAYPESGNQSSQLISLLVSYTSAAGVEQKAMNFTVTNIKAEPTPSYSQPPVVSPPPPPTIEFVKSEKSAIQVEGGMRIPSGDAGDRITLDLPLFVNGFYPLTNVYVRPKYASDIKEYPFAIENTDDTRRIGSLSPGGRTTVSFDFKLNEKVPTGSQSVKFVVGYTEHQMDNKGNVKIVEVESEIVSYVEVINGYKETEKPLEQGAITIASVDETGKSITTPSGNINDKVVLILPLKNRGGKLTNIEIIPQTSADQKEWPFKITSVNLGRTLEDMDYDDTVTLKYNFEISDKAVSGIHPVTFNCIYRENDQPASCKVVAYVNVVKGAPEATPIPTDRPESQPKILIRSYQFNPQSIFAGDSFSLELDLLNTSSAQDILNLSMVFKNADGIIMPAPGASNALYFDRIKAGQSEKATLQFSVRPNAENKPYMLDVALDYEDKDVKKYTATESLSVPVALKTRVTIDEPRAMAEGAMIGSNVPVSFQIVNMGKAQLYNVMVSIKSEGFEMEEAYFGGNVVAGATLRVDFNVLPLKPGKLKGDVVVMYENEYGEQTVKTMPLEFELMEEMPIEMPTDMGEVPPPQAKLGVWQIAGIAAGSLVLLAIIIVIIKKRIAKKREMELNDDLD